MRYSDPSGMTIADQIATIQKEIALLQQAINLQKQIIALTSGVETYSNGVQQGIFNPAQATQNIQTSGVSTPQTAGNAVGLTALGVMTIGPAIAAAAAAPAAPVAAVPLADAEPIGSALKADPYHIAPTFMKETADQLGKKFLITGADEEDYILTQVEGGLDTGKGMIKGIYEYIQDGAGQITHQIFKPGGIINGTPN